MRYPKALKKGDTIGVCAPSSGVREKSIARLNNAVKNVCEQGYKVLMTEHVTGGFKCVSADAATRAREFMELYGNPEVAAIIPPCGGEFLMDMLLLLDFEHISSLPPKWVCGYSDITTLLFPLTLMCDIATVHGSNFINMGAKSIAPSDMELFKALSEDEFTQQSMDKYGSFSDYENIEVDVYNLTEPVIWKSLQDIKTVSFEGRVLGGCLDTICKLIGTKFAPVEQYVNKYHSDGIVWTLESCEMNAGDIYRTLWQMRECGWFENASGFIIGRPDGYSDTTDFEQIDALRQGLGSLGVPVLYDADIGHIPPQMQLINGAYAVIKYDDGAAVINQKQIKQEEK